MSGTVISPDGTQSFPLQTTGPANGDAATADSVNNAFIDLETGVDSSRIALFGRKLRPSYRILAAEVAANPRMRVDPLGPLVLKDTTTGKWVVYNHLTNTTIDLKVDANGGVDLTAKIRYYLFAKVTSGVLGWMLDTAPPTGDLMYAGVDYTRVYVGTFLTDPATANKAIACMETGGVHLYTDHTTAPSLLGSGGTGNATVETGFNVKLTTANGGITPPYARELFLEGTFAVGGGSASSATISSLSGVAGQWVNFAAEAGATVAWQANLAFLSSGLFYYSVGASSDLLTVNYRGFRDPR